MAKTTEEAINFLLRNFYGSYSEWYVGVTASPDQRLFTDHGVSRSNDSWAYVPCVNDSVARATEIRFIKMGMDGGPGGGDSAAKTVYIYRKSYRTNP